MIIQIGHIFVKVFQNYSVQSKKLKFKRRYLSLEEHIIEQFTSPVRETLIIDVIVKIQDTMKETSLVLSGLNLFNAEVIYKSNENGKELLKMLRDHLVTQLMTFAKVRKYNLGIKSKRHRVEQAILRNSPLIVE